MQRHPHVDMVELDAFVGRIEAVEGQEGGGDVVGFPNQAALHLKAGKAKRAVQRLRPTVQVIEDAFQFDGGPPSFLQLGDDVQLTCGTRECEVRWKWIFGRGDPLQRGVLNREHRTWSRHHPFQD